MRALGTSAARRLVLRPDVGLVMAGEPDAPLLGEPLACYVPRSQDTFDGAGFMAALKAAGEPQCKRRRGRDMRSSHTPNAHRRAPQFQPPQTSRRSRRACTGREAPRSTALAWRGSRRWRRCCWRCAASDRRRQRRSWPARARRWVGRCALLYQKRFYLSTVTVGVAMTVGCVGVENSRQRRQWHRWPVITQVGGACGNPHCSRCAGSCQAAAAIPASSDQRATNSSMPFSNDSCAQLPPLPPGARVPGSAQ